MEINPRHPLIKELLKRVEANPEDPVSKNMAMMMFQTGKLFNNLHVRQCWTALLTCSMLSLFVATLRSGYMLQDASQFATHIDNMMKHSLGIPDAEVEEEEEIPDVAPEAAEEEADAEEDDEDKASKDEL